MAHRNWTEVFQYFINNEGVSYHDLSSKFGIPLGTIKDKAAKEQWQEKRQEIYTKALSQVEEATIEKIAEKKRQQIDLGRAIQLSAVKAIATGKVEPKTPMEVAQWIKTGIAIERKALDMDQQSPLNVRAENNKGSTRITSEEQLVDCIVKALKRNDKK